MVLKYPTALACTMLLATPASALTILDTSPAGPLSPYGTGWGIVFGGSPDSGVEAVASFTTQATYLVESVQFYGGGTGNIHINIRAGGAMPGAILHTTTFNPEEADSWTGAAGLHWILPAGTYFVGFNAPNTGSAIRMTTNFQNPAMQEMLGGDGSWTPLSALFSQPQWQRGLGIRILGAATPAGVPEPATWGMMIAGLATAGATVRARRSRKTEAATT